MRYDEMNESMQAKIREILASYDCVKTRLSIQLRDPESCQELLQQTIRTEEGDFVATYQVILSQPEPGCRENLFVSHELLDHWNVSLSQLREDALECEKKRCPRLNHIIELTEELCGASESCLPGGHLGNLLERDDYVLEDTLYVLTNGVSYNGASLILIPEIMEKISRLAEGDYYVLPASRHEVLILPAWHQADCSILNKMVASVNAQAVNEQDYLSHEVQYYDHKAKKLVNARWHEQIKKQQKRLKNQITKVARTPKGGE